MDFIVCNKMKMLYNFSLIFCFNTTTLCGSTRKPLIHAVLVSLRLSTGLSALLIPTMLQEMAFVMVKLNIYNCVYRAQGGGSVNTHLPWLSLLAGIN